MQRAKYSGNTKQRKIRFAVIFLKKNYNGTKLAYNNNQISDKTDSAVFSAAAKENRPFPNAEKSVDTNRSDHS